MRKKNTEIVNSYLVGERELFMKIITLYDKLDMRFADELFLKDINAYIVKHSAESDKKGFNVKLIGRSGFSRAD